MELKQYFLRKIRLQKERRLQSFNAMKFIQKILAILSLSSLNHVYIYIVAFQICFSYVSIKQDCLLFRVLSSSDGHKMHMKKENTREHFTMKLLLHLLYSPEQSYLQKIGISNEDRSNIDAGIGQFKTLLSETCGCSSVREQDERNLMVQPLQRKDR